ncbi:MAG: hypothetical protein IRZ16_17925 [Myxococcaceae bacterium]|nr:hypothetical protein [Myxococcaceae bacterium]
MALARSLVVPVLMFSAVAAAQGAPERLTFTGRLVRTDGTPESGTHTLRFVLYDQPTGGTNLWEETRTVTVSNGYYTVDLGAVSTKQLSSVFTGPERYLGISLDAQSEMQPRVPILSVPYALRATRADDADTATNADRLDGQDSTDFAKATHTHPVATPSTSGFMSSSDKARLDDLPSTFGGGLVKSGSSLDVRYAGSGGDFGTAPTVARSDHRHPAPSLQCTNRTASAPFPTGALAACQSDEVLTGGGCMDLPSGFGLNFATTAAPTSSGFLCRGTGGTVPSTVVTAVAICCKLQ